MNRRLFLSFLGMAPVATAIGSVANEAWSAERKGYVTVKWEVEAPAHGYAFGGVTKPTPSADLSALTERLLFEDRESYIQGQ